MKAYPTLHHHRIDRRRTDRRKMDQRTNAMYTLAGAFLLLAIVIGLN